MPLRRGDIVLLPFPWTDLTSFKIRPALVVSDDSHSTASNESVFIFITTKFYNGNFDFRLKKTDPGFKHTGLKDDSTFRISKIITLEQKLALRRLGRADDNLLKKIKSGLKLLLDL